MGLPNILIEFKTKASTAIKRGNRGIVAVMVMDTPSGVHRLELAADIPTGLTDANKAYVERAFWGGVNPINHLMLIVTDTIANGMAILETIKYDYLAAPPDISAEDATTLATTIKAMRDSKGLKVKAVLPNCAADHEGIVNFTTSNIKVGTNTYTSGEYCSRIAGLLAGTPLQQSVTFYTLPEVTDVPKLTKAELDAKIDAGEFCIFHDGEKVKVARGINSLTTIGATKGEDYKYIKIVDTMDLIYNDVRRTCEDNYIGKFPNSYDNKCNLLVAIQAYLEALRDDNILDANISTAIDINAQRSYLKSKNEPVEDMTLQEIKEANTQSYVFIQSNFKILNAIEDIKIAFYI